MKKGFYTIMSAQFFSSLADNALLVAAIELLRSTQAPAWQIPALTPMFALFYVILAPFVGAFADAVPKGKVMLVSNGIKIIVKRTVAEIIVETVRPIRERYQQIMADPAELDRTLALGAELARAIAEPKIAQVKQRVGFLMPAA